MLKALARLALVCAALLFASSVVFGQTAASPIRLSPQAYHVLDSIATAARTQRVETAACITAYSGTPLTLDSLGPATYSRADSLSIISSAGVSLCPFGSPSVHTHVAKNGILDEPSFTDLRSKWRDGEPFALIVAVRDSSWSLVLY